MRHPPVRRGVCAIIERDDGKILMHLRCKNAWIYPEYWAFFGGGVKRGELLQKGLRRELKNELGFSLGRHRLFRAVWHRKGGSRVLDHTYQVRWHPTRIRLGEGQGSRWFTVEEALRLKKLPPHERSDLLRLRTMRRRRNQLALAA
jgi:8-oxo-dGTP pyrophosphatase MutT (NUDIX family)